MIKIEDLVVRYDLAEVLKSINIELEPGLHLILGRNGSGKTTLLKTIAGLVKPYRGRVLVLGKDIHKLPRREAVKIVGYAWQNPYAGFVEATVRDELEFTSRIAGARLNQEIVEILVPRHLMDRNPFTLSGGEAKRVSIASVISLDQPIWLLDEPFDYLDSGGVEDVVKVIGYGLRKGKTVVVASANVAYTSMLRVDQVIVLHNGEVAFQGPADKLDSEILKKFGIPSKAMICGPSV